MRAFCCTLIALWGAPLWATEATLTEAQFLEDLPRVLTASRIAQSPLDAPAPVTIIDGEMIRASGFSEIHDVFRLVPGFLVAEWPEGSPVVVNHGLGDANSRRLQVLVDGRSVYDPLRGGVDWQDLPLRLEDIEHIEVVRAPNQASYGANAFQGVINIITRAPALDPGVGVYVSRGIRGFEDSYARMGRSEGDWEWRVSLSSREISSFQDRAQVDSYWGETVQRQALNAQAAWRPRADQEWRVQLGLSRGEDYAGTTVDPGNPFHERDNEGRFFQLAWRKSGVNGDETSLQYYHFARQEREAYTLGVVPLDLGVDMRRDDLEFQQILTLSKQLKAMWGAGVRHDQARSDHYLYGLGTVEGTQWQLFGNLDWQAGPAWLLHLGGMVEKHYFTETLFSPRLAVNYTLAPGHSLRASVGKGYRAPTIFEARAREVATYSGGIADVGTWSYLELDPEEVNFAELGYIGRNADLNLQVDARLFLDEYDKYIDTKSCTLEGLPGVPVCAFFPVPGYNRPAGFGHHKAFYTYNSGDLRVYGGDLTVDWRHPVLGRLVASLTHTRIDAGPMTDSDAEVSAPILAYSLLWNKAFVGGLTLSAGYYRMGLMKWPNDGDEQWPYRRLDLKIAKRLGKAGSEDEIALTLQSVNDTHTEFDDYLLERQAFVTLRLAW